MLLSSSEKEIKSRSVTKLRIIVSRSFACMGRLIHQTRDQLQPKSLITQETLTMSNDTATTRSMQVRIHGREIR